MDYRVLERHGLCSLCYAHVKRHEEKVFAGKSYKHKKLVVICTLCAEKIYNEVKKENQNG